MIRYKVSKGLRILFVGINPHPGSYRRGVPFSNNKMFWYLLSRSGCIKEDIEELRDDQSLRRIYNTRFSRVYRYGFLNVVNRPTRDVSMIVKGEEKKGRRLITESIKNSKPKVVCFIGKITLRNSQAQKALILDGRTTSSPQDHL